MTKIQTTVTGSLATLALTLAAAGCGGGGASEAPTPIADERPATNPQVTVAPQSGSVTTDVVLRASGFPAGATVRIGFGPPASEYEVISRETATGDGMVTTTVNVPNWAETGRDYVWVAVGPAGDEAISARFSVTD